jgi:hypothetical protein
MHKSKFIHKKIFFFIPDNNSVKIIFFVLNAIFWFKRATLIDLSIYEEIMEINVINAFLHILRS